MEIASFSDSPTMPLTDEQRKHLEFMWVSGFVALHCIIYIAKEYLISVWLLAAYPILFRIVANGFRRRDNQTEMLVLYKFLGWTLALVLVLFFYREYVKS